MSEISRRDFLKTGAMAIGTLTLGGIASAAPATQTEQSPPPRPAPHSDKSHTSPDKGARAMAKVYLTRDLSAAGVLKIYSKINAGIQGRTAIKFHSGEPKGPNLLPVEYLKALQKNIPNSALVECNVLYAGPRRRTASHRKTLKTNGFDFCPVDIMDAEGDAILPVKGLKAFLDKWHNTDPDKRPYTPGHHLTELAVGGHLLDYNSLVVYTHFKGHAMGGFGGSLKNISIGCASGDVGKMQIHGKGWPTGKLFLERMVEGGKAIVDHFQGRMACINVLKNISVDCDCDKNGAPPTCRDIGILGSTDVLAIDKASVSLIYALPAKERRDIVERIESREGLRQLEYMKTLGVGLDDYELIEI